MPPNRPAAHSEACGVCGTLMFVCLLQHLISVGLDYLHVGEKGASVADAGHAWGLHHHLRDIRCHVFCCTSQHAKTLQAAVF